ncbi:hypothetical protein F4823DRAFT_635944 [Ustulina deusta]|nr:hypothetical protein F4823DRAFT_635944 [Ustulina deusta]
MGNLGGNTEAKKHRHERGSSSKSNSSLNPKANGFGHNRPTEQQTQQCQQGQNWSNSQGQGQYRGPPPGLSVHGKSGRGGGWSQTSIHPVTQIPPTPGHYGQQYQQPAMMTVVQLPPYPATSFGGYQPMYQMPHLVGIPSILQPAPLHGGHQQQYRNARQVAMSYNQGVQNFSQNESNTTPQQPEATTQGQASIPGDARNRAVSGSSHAQPSPRSEKRNDKISKYRKDLEAARSFADDHVYIPNARGVPKGQK